MASTTLTTPSHPHGSSFPSSQGGAADPTHAQPTRRPLPGCESAAATAAASRASFGHTSQHTSIQSQHQSSSSQRSFTMSQPPSQPGNYALPNSNRLSANLAATPARYINDEPPQIYSATYSNVEVYEMEVNTNDPVIGTVAVMRRRHDSFLNATQILKVAKIDKGKRTRILEKEIQNGKHEKVQGGYGKYQGTWIPFDRARAVCRQYGVEAILEPLLTYDMGQNGGVAGQGGDLNTPTKEQAMAANRKRAYNQPIDSLAAKNEVPYFLGISPTARDLVATISKASFDAPQARDRTALSRGSSFSRQPSNDFPPNSQQSVDSAYSTQDNGHKRNGGGSFSPRKRQRLSMTPSNNFGHTQFQNMQIPADNCPGSPTEPNESFNYDRARVNPQQSLDGGSAPLLPLPYEHTLDAANKRSMLMNLFMEGTDYDEILESLTTSELDLPIDEKCNNALHWAATLARIPLVKALVEAGASPNRVNSAGQTALSRACGVSNTHDTNCFMQLMDLLGDTLDVLDHSGRTVVHHIAITSGIQGLHAASKYYLAGLLEWIVRKGKDLSSQDHGVNGDSGSLNRPNKLSLSWFMSEIVNARDVKGDTALNIAARIGNRSIANQLKEVGAVASLTNNNGLKASDFLTNLETTEVSSSAEPARDDASHLASIPKRSQESSHDIITSLTSIIDRATEASVEELRIKQQSIDTLLASLRTITMQLNDRELALKGVSEKRSRQQLSKQKVKNHRRAREYEQNALSGLDQESSHLDPNEAARWEAELDAARVNATKPPDQQDINAPRLPSVELLRARIAATRSVLQQNRAAEDDLKSKSTRIESKYRRLVAAATKCPEDVVDDEIVALTRAVESEGRELDIGRVRKFLGGVEGEIGDNGV